MIVWRNTGVAAGTPASQIRFPAASNSEKTAVPLTVPEFVVTVAKPLLSASEELETNLRTAPGGSVNVKTLEVVVDPVSSASVICQGEPAASGSLLSCVNVIAPVAVAEDEFARKIVVFQVVAPSTPSTTWG